MPNDADDVEAGKDDNGDAEMDCEADGVVGYAEFEAGSSRMTLAVGSDGSGTTVRVNGEVSPVTVIVTFRIKR